MIPFQGLLLRGSAVDRKPMVAAATTRSDLHSFRLAQPVVRRSSRLEVTAVFVLLVLALALWLLVIPAEFVIRLTV